MDIDSPLASMHLVRPRPSTNEKPRSPRVPVRESMRDLASLALGATVVAAWCSVVLCSALIAPAFASIGNWNRGPS